MQKSIKRKGKKSHIFTAQRWWLSTFCLYFKQKKNTRFLKSSIRFTKSWAENTGFVYQPCSNTHTTTTLSPISILHGAVSFLQWINLHRSIYIIIAQILQFTLGFILSDVHILSLDKCLITCTYYCHIIQNRFTAVMILCASHSHSPSPEFSSVVQSCLTLWDRVDCSLSGFPVHHQLPEFAQTHVHWVGDTIQPSHPLSSPSPAFSLSQHQGLFQWVTSLHQVAKGASASVLLMNIQDWFPLGLTGLIFLQSKGL